MLKDSQLSPESYYLLRTPALKFELLNEYYKLVNDHGVVIALKTIYRNNFHLCESVQLSSPTLFEQYKKWDIVGLKKKEEDKLIESLTKYLIRICTRPTPFGGFAGVSTGLLGSETEVVLPSRPQYTNVSHLDMSCVESICDYLTRDVNIRKKLRFSINNSLYLVDEYYRYVEFVNSNRGRTYKVSSVLKTEYLTAVFSKANEECYIDDLSSVLVNGEISKKEAEEFVNELIDNQLLISEISPRVTGIDNLHFLLNFLRNNKEPKLVEILTDINDIIEDKKLKHEVKIELTNSKISQIIPNYASASISSDLIVETKSNTISEKIVDEIGANLEDIIPLFINGSGNNLKDFIKRFKERFEEEEVPLSIVLDGETGIGFGNLRGGNIDHSPLIEGIHRKNETLKSETLQWSAVDRLKFNVFKESIKTGNKKIELSLEQLKSLSNKTAKGKFSESIGVFGQLILSNSENGFKFHLKACSGPSASRMLARFANSNAKLKSWLQSTTLKEESNNPDILFAEVVHYPDNKSANISLRPQLYRYEIPYMGTSSVPRENQIPISDILIKVEYDEIILRSKKLNKRILPRLSSAHNYHNSKLSVYKFLCEMQNDNRLIDVFWDWSFLNEEKFLPRISYKSLIISPAKWRIKYDDVFQDGIDRDYGLDLVIKRLEIPKSVLLVDGDNELLLNLSLKVTRDIFLNTLRTNREVIIVENYSDSENNIVKDTSNGTFTNEFIFPFVTANKTKSLKYKNLNNSGLSEIKRTFIPGSEWLYVKIYMGTKSSDYILDNVIGPFVEDLLKGGLIEKWFFIRYNDPNSHLRIRFYNSNQRGKLVDIMLELAKLLQKYVDSLLINNIQLDTYKRELERYGDETIEFSEDVFYFDSEAVVRLLNEEIFTPKDKWKYCIYGINSMLDDFEFSLDEKIFILDSCEKTFFEEFNGDNVLKEKLNNKFRENSKLIRSILDTNDTSYKNVELENVFNLRAKKIRERLILLKQSASNDINKNLLMKLVISYMHMFVNRLFISNQRTYELVIYNHLYKYYKSKLAILTKNKL